jgi:hypothetical protein
MTKLNEQHKVGIALAVVAALAVILAILLWSRSAKAAASSSTTLNPVDPSKPVTPAKPKEEIKVTLPTIPIGPDPYKPTTTPTKGQYYVPKHGDSASLICIKAGFTNIMAARKALRDHARNAWIPKTTAAGETEKQLDLDWGYAHMTAYPDKDWAWMTEHVASGGLAICLVYVPEDSEVGG